MPDMPFAAGRWWMNGWTDDDRSVVRFHHRRQRMMTMVPTPTPTPHGQRVRCDGEIETHATHDGRSACACLDS